jgi:hypothetical protein
MQDGGEWYAEEYEFIGRLAIALYPHGIKIRFETLQKILSDKGLHGAPTTEIGHMVCAALRYWEYRDPVIHLAIAHAFTRA